MAVQTIERAVESDKSVIRNSDYRKLLKPLDAVADFLDKRTKITANGLTVSAIPLAVLGFRLMSSQHRQTEYSKAKTLLAIGLTVASILVDGIDGKKARRERSKMVQLKADTCEVKGQMLDSLVDGIIEAYQAWQSFVVARDAGDKWSAGFALLNLATTNLPRTAKAIVGKAGLGVPESYKITDIREYGVSSGRKVPNYLASFVPKIGKVNVQGPLNLLTSVANAAVAAERIGAVFNPNAPVISEKEISHANYRAPFLIAQSALNITLAVRAFKTL